MTVMLITGLGIAAIKVSADESKRQYATAPSTKFTVEVPVQKTEEFISQLSMFSERNGFSMRVRTTRPNTNYFIAELNLNDIDVIALNSISVDEVRVGFYNNNKNPASERALDDFANQLIEIVEGAGLKITGLR